MEEPKKYELKTIEDIFNCIDANNVENFIEGFADGLRAYVGIVSLSRLAMEAQGKNTDEMKNTEIVTQSKFDYIDDGKQDNKVRIDTSVEAVK